MEDTCKEGKVQTDNLILQIKTKKRPRFKAGAELSGAVNRISVDVDESSDKDSETLELTIQLQRKYQANELEK